jgi:hypothetical protein
MATVRQSDRRGERGPQRNMHGNPSARPVVVCVQAGFPGARRVCGLLHSARRQEYVNSASMGAWEDFLLQEMLPTVEQRFGCRGTGRLVRRLSDFGITYRCEDFPGNTAGTITEWMRARRSLPTRLPDDFHEVLFATSWLRRSPA